MKKILAIVPAIALVIGFSSSLASAHMRSASDPSLTVTSANDATVTNNVGSNSNTGYNFIKVPVVRSRRTTVSTPASIGTGDASATSSSQTTAGSNSTDATAPTTGKTTVSSYNSASVDNNVTADANSGYNKIIGNGSITTGNATSSSSSVTLLGSNVTTVH